MCFTLKEKQKFINGFNVLGMKDYQKRGGFCVKKNLQVKPKQRKIF